jgi:hypothetical protein
LFYFVSIISQFVTLSSQKYAPEHWSLTYFLPKTALGLHCSKSALRERTPNVCQPMTGGRRRSERMPPVSLEGAHRRMPWVRHCVECPKCLTRYLPGFSPYRNGSYLMPLAEGFADEWTLYCACGRPPNSSRWSWSELKLYAVSTQAHDRGYGPPEEVVAVDNKSRFSG